ncbi:MAG: ATP-grasp domain-containing protein [Desulfobacter sp.]|nr:MAG: ATP-grasp domain-containing protein [Desulfobacter sp.]
MSVIHFSNFRLDEDKDYFLYIGELKNYGLNHFLNKALTRYFNRPFQFIAIVPDVLEQYNYDNLIVINPLVEKTKGECVLKKSCRINARQFVTAVSQTPKVISLIKQILRRQSGLFINMYESIPEMTLDEIQGVTILGPDKEIAARANNKTLQMSELGQMVPVVDFELCSSYGALISATDRLWDQWTDGIFVTKEYSAAGINSTVAACRKDIEDKFNGEETSYIISRFMPHTLDPTVLAVVAGEEDVFIAGVADQRIEDGNRFTGSTFPSTATPDQTREMMEYTRTVGHWLAGQGYRGIFGCDYIITGEGEIRFLEINARKQGTTLEFCCTLDQALPPDAPNLPELELWAVIEGHFPANAVEMNPLAPPVHWGTYNYKIHQPVCTETYIPQQTREQETFENVAKGRLKKDYLILEHIGTNFVLAEGAFLARVVAVGQDHGSVDQGITQARKMIELTFTTQIETEN